jgi:hypothetical protein
VARCQKGVNTVVRLFQQAAQGRDKRDVLAEKVKVIDVARLRLRSVMAVAGMVVSKPRPKRPPYAWVSCASFRASIGE